MAKRKDGRSLCFTFWKTQERSGGATYGRLRLLVWLARPEQYSLNARHYKSEDDHKLFGEQMAALVTETRSDEYFPSLYSSDGVQFCFQSGGQADMDLDHWYGASAEFTVEDGTLEVLACVQSICKKHDLRLHRYVDDLPQKLILALLAAGAVPLKNLELSRHRSEYVRDRRFDVTETLPTTAQRLERERVAASEAESTELVCA